MIHRHPALAPAAPRFAAAPGIAQLPGVCRQVGFTVFQGMVLERILMGALPTRAQGLGRVSRAVWVQQNLHLEIAVPLPISQAEGGLLELCRVQPKGCSGYVVARIWERVST